jgi:hypothetical protein
MLIEEKLREWERNQGQRRGGDEDTKGIKRMKQEIIFNFIFDRSCADSN